MYILVTYDVDTTDTSGPKRLRKVAKACLDHGQRVQNSVFECELTESSALDISILAEFIGSSFDIAIPPLKNVPSAPAIAGANAGIASPAIIVPNFPASGKC